MIADDDRDNFTLREPPLYNPAMTNEGELANGRTVQDYLSRVATDRKREPDIFDEIIVI